MIFITYIIIWYIHKSDSYMSQPHANTILNWILVIKHCFHWSNYCILAGLVVKITDLLWLYFDLVECRYYVHQTKIPELYGCLHVEFLHLCIITKYDNWYTCTIIIGYHYVLCKKHYELSMQHGTFNLSLDDAPRPDFVHGRNPVSITTYI